MPAHPSPVLTQNSDSNSSANNQIVINNAQDVAAATVGAEATIVTTNMSNQSINSNNNNSPATTPSHNQALTGQLGTQGHYNVKGKKKNVHIVVGTQILFFNSSAFCRCNYR